MPIFFLFTSSTLEWQFVGRGHTKFLSGHRWCRKCQGLHGLQLLPAKQSGLSEENWMRRKSMKEEQGASTDLWKGLSGKTRSNCNGLFSSPYNPSSSISRRGCYQCLVLWLGTSFPIKHAAVCKASSRLQSSAVQPGRQNLCNRVFFIARLQNWRCVLNEALKGKTTKVFPVIRQTSLVF